MPSFSFTHKGSIENLISNIKQQPLLDSDGKVIEIKTKWNISLNLDLPGRPLDFSTQPLALIHQSVSDMKLGFLRIKYNFNAERFEAAYNEAKENVKNGKVSWYEFLVLIYTVKISNDASQLANEAYDLLENIKGDRESVNTAFINVLYSGFN